MKQTTRILALAAVSLLAAAAQAETYDGVHALTNGVDRAATRTQAVASAHAPNPYAEGAQSGVTTVNSERSRAAVQADAVAAAHAPNQNLYREAFAGSVIPAAFGNGSAQGSRQALR